MPVVLFHDGDRTPRHASLRMALFFKKLFLSLPLCKYPRFHAAASVHRAGASPPENSDDAHADVRGCARLETKFSPPHPPPFKKYQTRETLGAATHRSGGGTQRGRREMTSLSLCVCQDRNELLTVDKTSECNNVCCSFFYFPGFSPNMRACCATL